MRTIEIKADANGKIKPRTKKQIRETEKQEAIEKLRKLAPPGTKIYGIVRHVARSGMSRTIDFYVPGIDAYGAKSMQYLSGYLATVLDWKRTDQGAIKVSGCGMDMIFHTVYSASWVVWNGTDASESRPRNGEKKPARCNKGGDAGYVWESKQL